MIIVAKATQEPNNGPLDYVEVWLPQYRAVHSREGRFAYAWTFNPDDHAIIAIRQNLPTWLYLIGEPWFAPLRMRIIDLRHSRQPLHCPEEWRQYCIPSEWCITRFSDQPSWPPIHLWFLVDLIEVIEPPVDVRSFTPYFRHKYHRYFKNSFGFFR